MGTTALTWRSVNVAPPPWLGSYGVVKMQTSNSAHVCTPTGQPPKLIQVVSPTEALRPETGDRRFWVIEPDEVADTPPTNWVGLIAIVPRCEDTTAKRWSIANLADSYHYKSQGGHLYCYATRYGFDRHLGKWAFTISTLTRGREWFHHGHAVMDDHGWLVEVPAC
jgi:hypothetical protein